MNDVKPLFQKSDRNFANFIYSPNLLSKKLSVYKTKQPKLYSIFFDFLYIAIAFDMKNIAEEIQMCQHANIHKNDTILYIKITS